MPMLTASFFRIVCVATLLVSCAPAKAPDETETQLPLATPSSVTASTEETTPPALPSHTPTAAPSPTSPQDTKPEQKCLQIEPALRSEAGLAGYIVFSGEGWMEPSHLLDLVTGREVNLSESGDPVANLHVSPNRKWLAYRRSETRSDSTFLVIMASDGEQVRRIRWDDSWRQISGWLDDERLWISRQRGSDGNDSLIVLDPFTGQQQELQGDFPDQSNISPGPGWGWFNRSATIYDSSLGLAIYPAGLNKIVLWDVRANNEIAVVTDTISLNVTPKWSPDGQRFLISGPVTLATSQPQISQDADREELFSVSREGEVMRLTYLTDHYGAVRFGDYAWSPDGRYVAFWLDMEPETYPDLYDPIEKIVARFAILDTLTQKVTDYCVPNRTLSVPVWSPDGHQVVIENNSQEIFKNSVFLLDITQNFAAKIGEDLSAVGWMK